jgi:hypothetical protein
MSLSDLASLGSFASGLAVTVTLIFLVIQTRQANRNQRALMQQGRAASQVDLLLRYSESYFGRVSLRARASDLTLSDDEISTSIFLCLANWRSFEDGFLQYRAGTLDLESFQSDTTILRHLLSYPSQRATWRLARERFAGGFRDHVDTILRETKSAHPPSEPDAWRKFVAEELAALRP